MSIIDKFYLKRKIRAEKKLDEAKEFLQEKMNEKNKGAELLEYVLITALIVLLIITVFAIIKTTVESKVNEMTKAITNAKMTN